MRPPRLTARRAAGGPPARRPTGRAAPPGRCDASSAPGRGARRHSRPAGCRTRLDPRRTDRDGALPAAPLWTTTSRTARSRAAVLRPRMAAAPRMEDRGKRTPRSLEGRRGGADDQRTPTAAHEPSARRDALQPRSAELRPPARHRTHEPPPAPCSRCCSRPCRRPPPPRLRSTDRPARLACAGASGSTPDVAARLYAPTRRFDARLQAPDRRRRGATRSAGRRRGPAARPRQRGAAARPSPVGSRLSRHTARFSAPAKETQQR